MKKYRIREFSPLWWAKYIILSAILLGIFISISWYIQ